MGATGSCLLTLTLPVVPAVVTIGSGTSSIFSSSVSSWAPVTSSPASSGMMFSLLSIASSALSCSSARAFAAFRFLENEA